jgi:hypothetical protein
MGREGGNCDDEHDEDDDPGQSLQARPRLTTKKISIGYSGPAAARHMPKGAKISLV